MKAACLRRPVSVLACFLLLCTLPPAVGSGISPEEAVQEPIETDIQEGFVEPRPGPGGDLPWAGWYLGVYGNYTRTGLVLTEVVPQSAAARAGLEVGDRIVAISGRQIGLLQNSRLDLQVALQRFADRNGCVQLLVQDHRTLRLVIIEVQLTPGRIHF